MARTPLLYLLLFLLLLAVGRDSGAEEIGPPQGEQITLMVPVTPRMLDPAQNLQPLTERWLSHLATRANLRMRIQPAAFDRRLADVNRNQNSCILGAARLPERENLMRWLAVIRLDQLVLIAAASDPFKGSLEALMREADDRIAAPSGIYRTVLEGYGVRYVSVEDQRALARMVAVGRIRFGIVIRGTLQVPEVAALGLRVVGEMPAQKYWFACSRSFPEAVAQRIIVVMKEEQSETLRKLAMDDVWTVKGPEGAQTQ